MFSTLGRFIDNPRAALPREVPPDPLDGAEKALPEIDEEIDVSECPKPGRPAFQRPLSEINDSSVTADHCGIAAVFEPKTLPRHCPFAGFFQGMFPVA
uniref:hypothetical protein n=1 Tax=Neorhizobium sp. EC2-8 TaxID=3129230 RepID=UPI0031012FC1